MGREQVVEIITRYINQVLSGQVVENAKLDMKSKWYDLSDLNGVNEFLKDTCSIANTPGPDGFVVIGVDDKECVQITANFRNSNLKDPNELVGIINKRIDRAFDVNYYEAGINGSMIGILHIPPSIDKPHVIKNYQKRDKKGNTKDNYQRIFIRSESTTREATKFDIERMIFDRKNIVPDYLFEVYINVHSFREDIVKSGKTCFTPTVVIENSGKRPASICEFNLRVKFSFDELLFGEAEADYTYGSATRKQPIRQRNIIIRANDIVQKGMNLYSDHYHDGKILNEAKEAGGVQEIQAEIVLNNGRRIRKRCIILN